MSYNKVETGDVWIRSLQNKFVGLWKFNGELKFNRDYSEGYLQRWLPFFLIFPSRSLRQRAQLYEKQKPDTVQGTPGRSRVAMVTRKRMNS